jgi:hypothetical protein
MGEHTEAVAAENGGKDNRFHSCETNHVSVSSKEDRGASKRTVGENQGAGKEGGIVLQLEWLLPRRA